MADIAVHATSRSLPERTKAALAWADVVLAGGHDAPPQVIADLQRLFAPDEIVEITYAIGTFIGYSKQIITLGMEPQNWPLVVVPTPR